MTFPIDTPEAGPKRPKSGIEILGERCLQVCRDHADDKAPDLRLIADFLWALGIEQATLTMDKKQ